MSERPFASYRYSAFISYASDDDAAWNSFVSCFTDELNLALGSRLHMSLPPAHLSGDDPLTTGSISNRTFSNASASAGLDPVAIVNSMIANPSGWYFNAHSTRHGGGVVRGQLVKQ
jgi:hypothetical protein